MTLNPDLCVLAMVLREKICHEYDGEVCQVTQRTWNVTCKWQMLTLINKISNDPICIHSFSICDFMFTFRCNDYLRFYLDLDRPEVNERNHWNYERCGNITMLEQKVVYSSGRSLILEFHSDLKPANHTGFRGIFRFLDESKLFQMQRKLLSKWVLGNI